MKSLYELKEIGTDDALFQKYLMTKMFFLIPSLPKYEMKDLIKDYTIGNKASNSKDSIELERNFEAEIGTQFPPIIRLKFERNYSRSIFK